MDNKELCALQDLKQKLLEKANSLIGKLKKQEENNQRDVTLELPDIPNYGANVEEKSTEEYELQIHEISRRVSGITFEDTDRKWLHDNVYMYKTCLRTKDLKIFVDLTVKLEGEIEYEILHITCSFVDIDKCCMLEVKPWVESITGRKNFSHLTSAISQYTELNSCRTKIIENLVSRKYVNCNKCRDGSGGILIFLHTPKDTEMIYLIIKWSLIFLEQTWQIEHCFEVKATETGLKFEEENRELLNNFYRPSINKEAVVELWSMLCSAVDSYRVEAVCETNDDDMSESTTIINYEHVA